MESIEQQEMLDKLGITAEEVKEAARFCYDAAWEAMDGALASYFARIKGHIHGAIAFAVWAYVVNECSDVHRGIVAADIKITTDEEAA